MKKQINTKTLALAVAMLFISLTNTIYNITYSQEVYPYVKIGNQEWMSENLDVSVFRNGDTIPEAKTPTEWKKAGYDHEPTWCYYNNDSENSKKYGKLYNWYAVNDPRGLAPEGWHIPSNKEWSDLIHFLGGEDVAGNKMKSTDNWVNNGNGNNESGFSCIPSGVCFYDGEFYAIGSISYLWSSSEVGGDIMRLTLSYDNDFVFKDLCNKKDGLSIRCLRD